MANKKHVFTPLEKKTFLDILKKYSRVVENKSTDGASLKIKNEAWSNLSREYNASPHVTTKVRIQQLRRLWMNLKQRQKDKGRQPRLPIDKGQSTGDLDIPKIASVPPALIVSIDEDPIPEPEIEVIEKDSQVFYISSPPVEVLSPTHSMPNIYPAANGNGNMYHAETTPTSPQHVLTPPLRQSSSTPPPHSQPSLNSNFQRYKNFILKREYKDRQIRAIENHELEILLLKEKIREARAKADLAELLLQQQRSSDMLRMKTENQ